MLELLSFIKSCKTFSDMCSRFDNGYHLNVCVAHHNFCGETKKIAHIARPDNALGKNMYQGVQEQASNLIVSEDLKLVSCAPTKIYDINDPFCEIKYISDNNSVTVQDKIEGIQVTISCGIISTRQNMFAKQTINGTVLMINEAVQFLLKKKFPNKGLDMLSSSAYFRALSWTFILSPIGGVYTSNVEDYDLYLIAIYNTKMDKFLSLPTVKSLALSLKFRTPKTSVACSFEQVHKLVGSRASAAPNVAGVILVSNQMEYASVTVQNNCKTYYASSQKLYKRLRAYVAKVISSYPSNAKGTVLSKIILSHRKLMLKEAVEKYEANKESVSAKALSFRIKKDPYAKIIFRLYNKRLSVKDNLNYAINPGMLAKYILSKNQSLIKTMLDQEQKP